MLILSLNHVLIFFFSTGLKLGAAAVLAVPMGAGAIVGAPVGALVGAKVGALKGALLAKALVLKKLALLGAALKWKIKKAMVPIVFLVGAKKSLLAAKAALISTGAKVISQKSHDLWSNVRLPVPQDVQIVQVPVDIPYHASEPVQNNY